MTLTSEMSRLTAEFEAAQRSRLAAVAKIASDARRKAHGNRKSLNGAMAMHRVAMKHSLRDIFGTTAFTRGAAEEMIERFRNEREEAASGLRDELGHFAANLRESVAETLEDLNAARLKKTRRDENSRRAELKDLRRRVETLLANSDKLMADISRDRQRAGRIWEQHRRNALRQRRAAARGASENAVAMRKPTGRTTATKRKHPRG